MKNFATRLLLFVFLLILVHVLLSVAFPVEMPPEVLRLDEYLGDEVDVLYFGDSTLYYPVGEVTTGEILQEVLPDHTVAQIAHSAYGLDVYLQYLRYVVRSAHQPQKVIVPINLRSFSPEWDMRPAYQFAKEKQVLTFGLDLSRLFLRPLGVFGLLDSPISQEQFLNAVVWDGDVPIGTVRDFEGDSGAEALQGDAEGAYRSVELEDDAKAQETLLYHYMFGLKPDHRKLDAMVDIAELCDENDIDLVFYLTSVNYLLGERFLGGVFSERLAANADVVKSRLEASHTANTILLDLSFGLKAYAFNDMEHLTENGKVYVAEQISGVIDPERGDTAGDPERHDTTTPEPSPTQPTQTATTAKPSPSPVVTKPAPTGVETEAATTLTVTATRITPTRAVRPSLTVTLTSTSQGTVVPSATLTATVSTPGVTPSPTVSVTPQPTPAPTRGPGGIITDVAYVGHFEPNGKYPVDMYRVRFQSLDETDQVVGIRADIYIPTADITTTFPVLGNAPGTTGLSNRCAPLNEQALQREWGNYHGYSLSYAAQGHIVILPNWLGFDDPDRLHPYFHAKTQARVLLDAGKAVYEFFEGESARDMLARPARAVFFMGYSSGGHAAFAAKDIASTYAPDLPVKGIIGHGPTTNVETLLKEDPAFSPYIIYAYRDFYGSDIIDVADVFLPGWVTPFEGDVLYLCVDGLLDYYSRSARRMYLPEFREVLYGDQLDQAFPRFAEALAESNAGLSGGTHIPVLILQGTADTVITPPSQQAFVTQLCDLGNSVTFLEYPAVAHYQIRSTSFSDTVAWMKNIVEGGVPESHCSDLVAER